MTRATLAAAIRRSIQRLPEGHWAIPAAMDKIELLESDVPITSKTMTQIMQNADWYASHLERIRSNMK